MSQVSKIVDDEAYRRWGGDSIITPVAQRLLRNTTFLTKYRVYTTLVRNANCRISVTVISMHQEGLVIIMY